MIAKIIEFLSGIIVATISLLGYSGIILLMAIESACIPLPSEIIMPFSGYLVSTGQMNLWLVGIAGAVGCVLGSLVAYWVGSKRSLRRNTSSGRRPHGSWPAGGPVKSWGPAGYAGR